MMSYVCIYVGDDVLMVIWGIVVIRDGDGFHYNLLIF